MKTFLWIVVLIGLLGMFAGCHSGTTRGIGSDISELGDHMQK